MLTVSFFIFPGTYNDEMRFQVKLHRVQQASLDWKEKSSIHPSPQHHCHHYVPAAAGFLIQRTGFLSLLINSNFLTILFRTRSFPKLRTKCTYFYIRSQPSFRISERWFLSSVTFSEIDQIWSIWKKKAALNLNLVMLIVFIIKVEKASSSRQPANERLVIARYVCWGRGAKCGNL